MCYFRAVGRSVNPEGPVLFDGHNLSPLVEIGLTDLPESGCAMAHPETTGLHSTTPIMAMGCWQCLPLSVIQLKGKHCQNPIVEVRL